MKIKSTQLLCATILSTALIGCANVNTTNQDMAMSSANVVNKTVNYQCLNHKNVAVSYLFNNDNVSQATVLINNKAVGKTFERHDRNAEEVRLISGNYEISLESSFALPTASQANLVMIIEKGKNADLILAKSCEIINK